MIIGTNGVISLYSFFFSSITKDFTINITFSTSPSRSAFLVSFSYSSPSPLPYVSMSHTFYCFIILSILPSVCFSLSLMTSLYPCHSLCTLCVTVYVPLCVLFVSLSAYSVTLSVYSLCHCLRPSLCTLCVTICVLCDTLCVLSVSLSTSLSVYSLCHYLRTL